MNSVKTVSAVLLVVCMLTTSLSLAAESVDADSVEPAVTSTGFATIEEFAGMNVRYRVGFLWMNRVADGVFSLVPGKDPDTYRAKLVGKTRGFSAWVTSDRIQSYNTLMKKQADGRLITLTHDSSIERGKGKKKKVRTKHYAFDEQHNLIHISKTGNGGVPMWTKEYEIEGEQMPVDILTSYFNFVTGVYGPIKPGARYVMPAFGGKDEGEIIIEVFTDENRPDNDFFPGGGLLCKANVDKEVFDTKDGTILVWFDDNGSPARGVVENIIGMGDVRGVMR